MIRKSQLFLAVAALVGMNAAMAACNTTQWGQGGVTAVVGTPIADGPVNSDANVALTPRYSGKCGLASAAAAAGAACWTGAVAAAGAGRRS